MDVSLSELGELVMDREAWRAGIHGVAKSDWATELTDWPEKGMPLEPCGPKYQGGRKAKKALSYKNL